MKFRSIKYYLSAAFFSLVRNRLMSIASILTVASCIFMVSISYCIASNVDYILKQFEGSIGISVIIKDDALASDVTKLHNKISQMEYIEEVKYISSDDALKSFSEELGDDQNLIAGLEKDNPLPRSFDIKVSSIDKQAGIIEELNKLKAEGVDSVKHLQETTDALIVIDNAIRIVSMVVIFSLAIISIVIIMNTIKITVNARKNEINIMKYVGATDWFIRWPFILEGILIGLTGAVIPISICFISYDKVLDMLSNTIPIINVFVKFEPVSSVFSILLPISIILGILIGAVGSVSSIRKYLKV